MYPYRCEGSEFDTVLKGERIPDGLTGSVLGQIFREKAELAEQVQPERTQI